MSTMRVANRTTDSASTTGRPVSHLTAMVSSSSPGKYGLTGKAVFDASKEWPLMSWARVAPCSSSSKPSKMSGLRRM